MVIWRRDRALAGVDHANTSRSGAGTLPSGIARSLRSLIVLCGAVRKTPLARTIQRSIVDLPLSDGTTLADRHIAGAAAFAARHGLDRLGVRLLVDADSETPRSHDPVGAVRCTVERDASPIRGVAGILSDATKDHEPGEYVAVINGAQLFREPLDELLTAMVRKESDVSMVACADGTPVGIWLIRCGVLRTVREVGYIDLKEQSLPDWQGMWKVSVVERQRAYAMRTRTINEYLNAVRRDASGVRPGASVDEDPYREEWERSFAILEPGATVAGDVIVHDSVVLAGATIGKGAMVVRSVICPGATVAPGDRVVGQVYGTRGRV